VKLELYFNIGNMSSKSKKSKTVSVVVKKTDGILLSGRGLKDICKQRLFEVLRTVEPLGKSSAFKILIVDAPSLAMINSVCTMFDIMQENISLVESLTKRREPLEKIEAVYLVRPTYESVQQAIDDFRVDVDKKRNIKLYRSAHLIFLSELSDDLLAIIGPSALSQNIRTLKEVNLDFIVYESQVFCMGVTSPIPRLFGQGLEYIQGRGDLFRENAISLGTFCVTLDEFPYIRYANSSAMCGDFADLFKDHLYSRNASITSYPSDKSLENRSTIIILDRTIDPIVPLIHDFTYAAMAYDLLGIDPTTHTYERTFVNNIQQISTEKSLLNEEDELWVQFRHGHTASVCTLLSRQFQEFLAANKSAMELTKANADLTKKVDTRELRDAVNQVPQFRDMYSKYSLHLNIAGACRDQTDVRNIVALSAFEKECVTGKKKVTLVKLAEVLRYVTHREDRLRVLSIFLLTHSFSDEERGALYQRFEMTTEERRAIENLLKLGVQSYRPKPNDNAMESWYKPMIGNIIDEFNVGMLDTSAFPYIGDAPELISVPSSSNTKWVKKYKSRKDGYDTSRTSSPRLIIFVLGGITQSEIRSVYELSTVLHREIFIGSTHIITPKSYIEQVSKL